MSIATLGRTVTVLGVNSNGSDEHPGVITRAWSGRDTKEGAVAVNLTVLPDLAPPVCHSSVMLHHTEQEARAYRAAQPNSIVAFWPSRVS